jgi:hypothetical protein
MYSYPDKATGAIVQAYLVFDTVYSSVAILVSDVRLSDVRYYLASSPGPIRSWCTYAGAPPCGKTTTGEHKERRIKHTQQAINHQVASPLLFYYLTPF